MTGNPLRLTQTEWAAAHLPGHRLTLREHYIECSCGATYWFEIPVVTPTVTPTCPRCLSVADHSSDEKQCSDNCITRYQEEIRTLREQLVEQRVIGHGEGQQHAIADVNAGRVDDLIAPRLLKAEADLAAERHRADALERELEVPPFFPRKEP